MKGRDSSASEGAGMFVYFTVEMGLGAAFVVDLSLSLASNV